jgi:hypothetical protein
MSSQVLGRDPELSDGRHSEIGMSRNCANGLLRAGCAAQHPRSRAKGLSKMPKYASLCLNTDRELFYDYGTAPKLDGEST